MSRKEIPDHWTPIQEAAWRMVHEFRKGQVVSGATALAPFVSKTPRTLDNEVNPDASNAKLSIEDAVMLMNTTKDYRLLEAMATTLGFAVMEVGDFSGVSDVELLNVYAAWNEKIGRTHAVIRKSLADGRIESRELEAIRIEMFGDFRHELGVLSRLEAIAEGMK